MSQEKPLSTNMEATKGKALKSIGLILRSQSKEALDLARELIRWASGMQAPLSVIPKHAGKSKSPLNPICWLYWGETAHFSTQCSFSVDRAFGFPSWESIWAAWDT